MAAAGTITFPCVFHVKLPYLHSTSLVVRLKNIPIINNLVVHKKNMLLNVELLKGLPFSQNVLIFLIENGVSREDAYKIVQECALKTWNEKTDFKVNLISHPILSKFNLSKKIDQIFTNSNLFKNVDLIFKRVI